jgi:hypothetical protein
MCLAMNKVNKNQAGNWEGDRVLKYGKEGIGEGENKDVTDETKTPSCKGRFFDSRVCG